jgi:hypothetical protein
VLVFAKDDDESENVAASNLFRRNFCASLALQFFVSFFFTCERLSFIELSFLEVNILPRTIKYGSYSFMS